MSHSVIPVKPKMHGVQNERARQCNETLLKLLFKVKIAAFLLFQYLQRDKVDERI